MRLIVLAAGTGKRMGDIQKGMIDAGDGKPLLHHSVMNAKPFIDAATIVTGRYHCSYEAAMKETGVEYELLRNHVWAVAGNAISVHLALSTMHKYEPYILSNSDVITSRDALEALVDTAKIQGEACGVVPGETYVREGYAGIACVYSDSARQRVKERVDELLKAGAKDRYKLEHSCGHWDVFFRPPTEGAMPTFPEAQRLEILPGHRIEIDTYEDLAAYYLARLKGEYEALFRRWKG